MIDLEDTVKAIMSFVSIILILIPIIKSNSAEIIETRYYSESAKTRVVFRLDEIAQYKAKYDQDRNINIIAQFIAVCSIT